MLTYTSYAMYPVISCYHVPLVICKVPVPSGIFLLCDICFVLGEDSISCAICNASEIICILAIESLEHHIFRCLSRFVLSGSMGSISATASTTFELTPFTARVMAIKSRRH